MQTTKRHFENNSVFPRLSIDLDGWLPVSTSLDMGIIRWASGIPYSNDEPLVMFARTSGHNTRPRKRNDRVPKYNNKDSCLSGVVVYFGTMYAVDFFPSLDIFQWKECEKQHITE